MKNKKNSHARQEISNRKNGKSTRISLNWWILYVHYNLKFKAVGFSVPSKNAQGRRPLLTASACPPPCCDLSPDLYSATTACLCNCCGFFCFIFPASKIFCTGDPLFLTKTYCSSQSRSVFSTLLAVLCSIALLMGYFTSPLSIAPQTASKSFTIPGMIRSFPA